MDRLLKLSDVEDVTGIRRAWIYELLRQGVFPCQVRVGKRAVRWRESEICEWIASRERAR